MNPTVILYTSRFCPVCKMVRDFLDMCDIAYQEVFVDIHPIARVKLIGKTGKLTVPQTHVNGKWISGFDPEKMLQACSGACHSPDTT